MSTETVYYLANFHYGELRIAVGKEELEKTQSSKDSWEIVSKGTYDQLKTMYRAGVRDTAAKVLKGLNSS